MLAECPISIPHAVSHPQADAAHFTAHIALSCRALYNDAMQPVDVRKLASKSMGGEKGVENDESAL
jgi:hypothetical protein